MKIYCDTDTLFHNIQRHEQQQKVHAELTALEQLLAYRQAGKLSMCRSRVNLRELEKTAGLSQREKLRADYEALDQIPKDERLDGFQPLTSGRGHRVSFVANPLVSDVQDEALCKQLEAQGLKRQDAEHITQAVCNRYDVFLTRDERSIIKSHRAWIEKRFSGFKVRLPSEFVLELKRITSP